MAACVAMTGLAASAQTRAPRPPRMEFSAAVLWTGSVSYGSRSANETRPDGSLLPLFSTTSKLSAGTGLEGRLAARLGGHVQAELTGTWSLADLQTTATGDFENAASTTSTLGVSVFTVEGAALWLFPRVGKLQPFVRGGGGWLRELTSDRALTGDGTVANAGAGVKYFWYERSRGFVKRFGLRSDLRLVWRSGGLSLGTKANLLAPAVTAGVIIGF